MSQPCPISRSLMKTKANTSPSFPPSAKNKSKNRLGSRGKSHVVPQTLRMLALRLLLVLLLLELPLHLVAESFFDQRVGHNSQRAQISGVRLPGDERVRGGLRDAIDRGGKAHRAKRQHRTEANSPRNKSELRYTMSSIIQ